MTNEDKIVLLGASKYPGDYVDSEGVIIPNKDVVHHAFETSEVKTPEEWNELEDNYREAWIEGVIRDNDLTPHVEPEPARAGADWNRFFDENDDEVDAIDLMDLNASDIERLLEGHIDDDRVLAMSAALGEATDDIRTARLNVMRVLSIFEQIGNVGIRLIPLFA